MANITLKTPAKIALFALAGVVLMGGIYGAYVLGFIPGYKPTASSVPKTATVTTDVTLEKSTVAKAPLPTSKVTKINKPPVRMLLWAWNSQMGQMLANGGVTTTQGSLMEKHGVKVQMTRQDDAEKMKADLIACAQELKNGGANCAQGTHFVQIMGDGYAQFAASINETLKKLGPEYTVRVVGSAGRSLGEDKFMGPPEWLQDPQKAKGSIVFGYLRDGDWNITMKWAADNGIKNNPDEKTYDPDAINWVAADSYIDAVNKLISKYSENRPVVRNGKKTGEMVNIGDAAIKKGVVTWTPGDVMVAEKVGGLVSILSTKENQGQMPNAIIGINKWMQDNRETVEEMLAAIFEGGDQVKAYPEALDRAAEISAQVYGEQNAAYWKKYYEGTLEKDKSGQMVELGGSAVHNLKDNLNLFGLTAGKANEFEATYTVFGQIVVQQYPRLVPNFPPFKDVADTSYLEAVSKRYQTTAAIVEEQKYDEKQSITQQKGNRDWNAITFQTGQATLTPEGLKTLEQLSREMTINNFAIEIHGHTDNVGNPQSNLELSRRRAQAVKEYLERKFPGTFPSGRIRITAHGDTQPKSDNNSDVGRAQNRRVQIVIGTT